MRKSLRILSRYHNYHIQLRSLPWFILFASTSITPYDSNKNIPKNQINKALILPKVQKEEESTDINLESQYFPTKAVHANIEPNANAMYHLCHSFSSIINGYKMAEVPSPQIFKELFAEELDELNKFSERRLVNHKFIHSKEYMRFHVTLKPFAWLENIPVLNYLFNFAITAHEDWIVDWKEHRAECLITNESLRWTFSVDELVIIQGIEGSAYNTVSTELHKSLYVNTFVPIPSIMFSNYKQYSDSYINVIQKFASFRCSSSSVPIDVEL